MQSEGAGSTYGSSVWNTDSLSSSAVESKSLTSYLTWVVYKPTWSRRWSPSWRPSKQMMKCGVWRKSFAKCVSGRLYLPPQRSGVSLSASAMKHIQIVGKCGALNNYTYARFCQRMAMMMEFRADSSGRRKVRSCWN